MSNESQVQWRGVAEETFKSSESFLLDVHQMLADCDFLKIEEYLTSPGVYSILGRSNQEDWYSHVIAWLLNPKSRHGLGDFPLKCILAMANACCTINQNENTPKGLPGLAVTDTSACVESCVMPDSLDEELDKEKCINSGEDSEGKGRLDIAMTAQMKRGNGEHSRLLLVIENKICSSEGEIGGESQTKYYADWAWRPHKSRVAGSADRCPHYPLNGSDKCFDTARVKDEKYRVLIFLSAKSEMAKDGRFVSASYVHLMRYVLCPCLNHPLITGGAKRILSEFIREIDMNGYASSEWLIEEVGRFVSKYGDVLRILLANCLYNNFKSKGCDVTGLNFRLNWMTHFCQMFSWGRSVNVQGGIVSLSPNEKPCTQKVHWEILPMRDPPKSINVKNANLRVLFDDDPKHGITIEEGWNRCCNEMCISEETCRAVEMIQAHRGRTFECLIRVISAMRKHGNCQNVSALDDGSFWEVVVPCLEGNLSLDGGHDNSSI